MAKNGKHVKNLRVDYEPQESTQPLVAAGLTMNPQRGAHERFAVSIVFGVCVSRCIHCEFVP
jgi:hypothetical protein